jgi:phosphate uptake regulator
MEMVTPMVSSRNIAPTTYVPADGSAPAGLITAATEQAFLITKDAIYNVTDFLSNGSIWAFRTIADCEKELDKIERTVDSMLPKAITHVAERRARELLACVRVVTELERVADLMLHAAHEVRPLAANMSVRDRADLLKMTGGLKTMVDESHAGMNARDVQHVATVIRADDAIDRFRDAIFRRHLGLAPTKDTRDRIRFLFAAQALERAGDHMTNIAEELYRLIYGMTLRHMPEKEKKIKLERA